MRRLGSATWVPDGKQLVYAGIESGHAPRIYVRTIPSGAPRPITPEGFFTPGMTRTVSPDGRSTFAVSQKDGSTWIFPIDGGQARRLDTMDAIRDRPVRWTADGRGLYIRNWKTLPFQLSRLDLESGARAAWKQVAPSDPAGAEDTPMMRLSADGQTCVYSLARKLSTLYVVDGLR